MARPTTHGWVAAGDHENQHIRRGYGDWPERRKSAQKGTRTCHADFLQGTLASLPDGLRWANSKNYSGSIHDKRPPLNTEQEKRGAILETALNKPDG
jgi:hypothetical protein